MHRSLPSRQRQQPQRLPPPPPPPSLPLLLLLLPSLLSFSRSILPATAWWSTSPVCPLRRPSCSISTLASWSWRPPGSTRKFSHSECGTGSTKTWRARRRNNRCVWRMSRRAHLVEQRRARQIVCSISTSTHCLPWLQRRANTPSCLDAVPPSRRLGREFTRAGQRRASYLSCCTSRVSQLR